MNILAFDTAAEIFSAGLLLNNQEPINKEERYYLEIIKGEKHSELIMGAADTLLNMAGISKNQLEAVACMKGPGSFTGLRIGFAAAKGLALALGIPILTIPTLDCMAFSCSFWPGIVLPVMDAKKNCLFTALYRCGKRISDYLDTGMEELIKTIRDASAVHNLNPVAPYILLTGPASSLVLSDLTQVFPDTVSEKNCEHGYANELLSLAKKDDIIGNKGENYSGGPLYLRLSDAELNKKAEKQNG